MTRTQVCAFFAQCAAGSGIPEIKCFLNGMRNPDWLTFRTSNPCCLSVVHMMEGGGGQLFVTSTACGAGDAATTRAQFCAFLWLFRASVLCAHVCVCVCVCVCCCAASSQRSALSECYRRSWPWQAVRMGLRNVFSWPQPRSSSTASSTSLLRRVHSNHSLSQTRSTVA